jgi:hypothetical protein
MGLAIGDVDHDGYPDVAFSNIGPNYSAAQSRRRHALIDVSAR